MKRLTRLETNLLAEKLSVANLAPADNDFAAAAKTVVGDLHPVDFVRVVEDAYRIAEHRSQTLDELIEELGAVHDKKPSDGTKG